MSIAARARGEAVPYWNDDAWQDKVFDALVRAPASEFTHMLALSSASRITATANRSKRRALRISDSTSTSIVVPSCSSLGCQVIVPACNLPLPSAVLPRVCASVEAWIATSEPYLPHHEDLMLVSPAQPPAALRPLSEHHLALHVASEKGGCKQHNDTFKARRVPGCRNDADATDSVCSCA